MTRVFLVVLFSVVSLLFCDGASAQCSWGYYAGGYMCRCPDGSFANLVNGRIVCPYSRRPSGIDCGNNTSCPYGTQCCNRFGQCCHDGSYCSVYGCIAIGSVDCGGYYCHPGQKCASGNRCIDEDADDCGGGQACASGKRCWWRDGKAGCVTKTFAFAHRHAKSLAKWLGDNNAKLRGTVAERHAKGKEYVRDNSEVRKAIDDIELIASGYLAGSATGNPVIAYKTAQAADFYVSYRAAEQAGELLANDHYDGSVALVNLYSSAIVDRVPVVPPGATEVLNFAGAATSAYAYGFFFAP